MDTPYFLIARRAMIAAVSRSRLSNSASSRSVTPGRSRAKSSIVEAMATGSWVLARRCPGATTYVGAAGSLYDAEDDAVALVEETVGWDTERWRRARVAAVERAYGMYADSAVLRPVLDDWLRLAAARAHRVQPLTA